MRGRFGESIEAVKLITSRRLDEPEFYCTHATYSILPATRALKKLKIGDGLDVEVTVDWNRQRSDNGSDARIDIAFTVGELVEECQVECAALGEVTDVNRVRVRCVFQMPGFGICVCRQGCKSIS